MSELPKDLQQKPFTYREASEDGLTQYAVRQLLEAGIIERVERGLYRCANEDLSESEAYRRAVKRVGEPSAVCLLSALSHYDLTDIIPKQVWLMVPTEKRTKSPNVKLYRARDPRWKIGVINKDGYSITSLERTIVDALTLKSVVSPSCGIEALKLALKSKRTSAEKIIQMAKKLGRAHRVIPVVEVLS